jgi:DNA-binding GntR family transcriptional regulator
MSQQAGPTGPKYRRIAVDLLARIEAGEYPPGSQLPTKAELMERHHVALNTVERAIAELRAAGLVETVQGSGMFVREPPDSGSPAEAVAKRFDDLESEIADLRGELREGLSLLQAHLMNLYQSTGQSYPYEDGIAGSGRQAG